MSSTKLFVYRSIVPRINFLLAVLFTLFILNLSANAQIVTTTKTALDGRTPSAMQPGSPAGSYPLSGFDNVNLYNGNLLFRLPLLKVDGRGSAQMTVNVALNVKGWHIKHQHRVMPDENELNTYTPSKLGWSPYSGYGAGRLTGRNYGLHVSQNLSCRWYSKTLSRMTFSTADGTEYELRDQNTGGQPLNSTCTTGANRGTVFITADGTAATFISDTAIIDNPQVNTFGPHGFSPSGLLKLRDGTTYRIDSGAITWIRDRNGNKISFTYATNLMTITDSLNRTVTINYNVSDIAPYGLCDQIIFKGFGGAQRIIRVSRTNLANVLRPGAGYTIRTLGGASGLFPETNGSSATIYDPTVTSVVWLPDGRTYKFYYNSYGEVARVELPTGGAFEYDMTPGSGVICPFFCAPDDDRQIYRRVVERRVYSNGGTGSSFDLKEVYATNEVYGSTNSTITVEQLSPSGTVLGRSRHFFATSALNSMFGGAVAYAYPAWFEGNETQTEKLATTGAIGSATVLRRTVTTRAQRAPVSWWASHAATNGLNVSKEPPNDPRVTQTVTTIEPASTNLVTMQTLGYDDSLPFNNQNNVKEYAFGTGAAGGLVRETRTTYVTSATYTGQTAHIRSLPLQVSVHDAGGTERSRSLREYDNYASDSSHAALVNRSNVSGFDTAFTTGYTTRGNETGSTAYLLSGGVVTGSISTFSQYDILGNVVKNIDGRGNAINYFYTDCFGAPNGEAQTSTDPSELGSITKTFALPTEARNALNQSTFTQFDYYLKQPVDVRDANGTLSSSYFNDILDRITQVRRGVGTALENRTTFSYDDANRIVTSANDRDTNGDGILVTRIVFDPLGRSIEKQEYEGGSNYIATQTQYDGLGRAFRTSNPFRPWQGESAVWTTQGFDALGRVSSVTTPDNAVVTTSYTGNSATVSDQTGKQRKTVTDALGRVVQVYEAPNNPSFNYLTDYGYDTLDNVTTITQGTQTRTRAYDSLKRLTSATNLESGTVSFQYDNANNVVVQTDARGVSSHFEYDVLNRLTRRWYNGSSSTGSTTHNSPALPAGVGTSNETRLFYDSQSLPGGAPSYSRGASVGLVVAQTHGGGSNGDYFAYDALGRVTLKIQQTGAVNYQMSGAYNRANALISVTYPSGRTISNAYDAAGRLTTFSGNLGDGITRTYASEILYSPFGLLAKEKFGTTTSVYNKLFYNVRGQLAEIRESTSYTGPTDTTWNRGAIINHFSYQCWGMCTGFNMTDNNGALKKQDVFIPHDDQVSSYTMRWQEYDYDALNRLNWVREISSASVELWKQQFTYDRWGNRTINTGVTYGTGINNKAFTVNTANNRLGVPVGQTGVMSYDAAGNLTNDTYTGAGNRTYDAENKITSAWGGNNQAQLYTYDGNGQRIKRTVNGVETWHVYGLAGELLAEYPVNGPAATPQKEYGYRNGQLLVTASPGGGGTIHWLVADHLNTPRIIIDKTGSLANVKRHDYLPFGEELFAPTGGRSTAQGYAPGDGVRQQFTAEERDVETGLDYFGARYYGSTQGRFTTPDDFLNDTNVSDPQSWNLYTYVRNNPVKYIDPTGRIKTDAHGNVITEARNDNDPGVVRIDGKDYFVYREVNASGTVKIVLWQVEKVNVFADDGTKIKAYKATGDVQLLDPSKISRGSDGSLTSQRGAFTSPTLTQAALERMAPGQGPFSGAADCHGVTFAKGQVWINNDQVKSLMTGDGYDVNNPSRTPTAGAVGIYSSDGSLANTVHSVTVQSVSNGNASVISKGGILGQVVTTPTGAWRDRSAQVLYYQKKAQR